MFCVCVVGSVFLFLSGYVVLGVACLCVLMDLCVSIVVVLVCLILMI